jgi:hypothetical protein
MYTYVNVSTKCPLEECKIESTSKVYIYILDKEGLGGLGAIINHDDDVYLEYYSGKEFHINYSVYMSYVRHINSSSKA